MRLAGAEVLLTAGTTQSLAIITHALLPPGGRGAHRAPDVVHGARSLRGRGRSVIALPVDDEGLEVGGLADAVLRCNPPSCTSACLQNPPA